MLELATQEDRRRSIDEHGNTTNLIKLCASIYFGAQYSKVSPTQMEEAWKSFLQWYQK